MKLADYIVTFLVRQKIKHGFVLTGGAVAHIVDSFRKYKDIDYVCVLHEQAGTMAAEAYSRMTKNLGVMMVTSGPGATNMLTGICCAWFDSIPILCITGQVNTFESKGDSKVRQVGFQETEIVDIVKSVTKYAVRVDDPKNIRFELEKAVYLARSGRPGPVLVDIPMNVQRAQIKVRKLKKFTPPKKKPYRDSGKKLQQKVKQTLKLMAQSQRPVILVGGGIRLSDTVDPVRRLARKLKIPVVCTWSGIDIFGYDQPWFFGQMGVYGNRGANFVVQNADFLLSLGSRLDTRITGGKPQTYARGAKKVVIDIDYDELHKRRGLDPAIGINTDVAEFMGELNRQLVAKHVPRVEPWINQAQDWKRRYPAVLPAWRKRKTKVNPYVFIDTLSDALKKDDVVITDCGGNLTWTLQAFKLKQGQRLFSAFGNSPMGYAFPASVGASLAMDKKSVICITGDGGLQINIQELQTVVAYKLPLKIFILNNHSYGIIKQFQDMYFGSRHEATNPEGGVTVPDFIKIGKAYGLKTVSIRNHRELRRKIRQVLKFKGAVLCDVIIPDDSQLIPKLEFGRPIEDLGPLLPRKEFNQNMIVPPYQEDKNIGEGV